MKRPIQFFLGLIQMSRPLQAKVLEDRTEQVLLHVHTHGALGNASGFQKPAFCIRHCFSKLVSVVARVSRGYVKRSAFCAVSTLSFFARSPSFRRLPTIS